MQRINIAALSAQTGNDNPLLADVRQMIDRRQAAVRPGEPAYRPQFRFLVHADGLRSYYLAYPALESLKLTMTVEHLEDKSPK